MSPVLAPEQAGHGRWRRSAPCSLLPRRSASAMNVWIDLTNSPHVLVMRPVIERLRADGHEVSGHRARFRPDDRACASGSGSPTPRSGTTAAESLAAKARGLTDPLQWP